MYGGVGKYERCDGYGCGAVFGLNPSTGAEAVLHSFGSYSDDGVEPSGLIDARTTLYGTTPFGGVYGRGTVFAVTKP